MSAYAAAAGLAFERLAKYGIIHSAVGSMDLHLNKNIALNYRSGSQKARVLTELWVKQNMFCPRCGNNHIDRFKNNKPVVDFYCPSCGSEYELKSTCGKLGLKVSDGAYETMIQRITGNNNPDFFFMEYSLSNMAVSEFIMVPKFFFVPDIIEKRPPLSPNARRAGWVGCNIMLEHIPHQGKIEIICRGREINYEKIMQKVRLSQSLQTDNIRARGWLMDILNCVNKTASDEFTLNDMYRFEGSLAAKHRENHNIRAKIRQQLQVLRNKGIIVFLGRGIYKKAGLSL